MSDWRDRAACRGEDPELFFPVGTSGPALLQTVEAKSVCMRCDVSSSCLTWALESGQDAGVWGGMTEDERRALKRRKKGPKGTKKRQPAIPPPPPEPTTAELQRKERDRRARRAAYARMYRARRRAAMTPEQLAAHRANRARSDRLRYVAAKAARSSAATRTGAAL